MGYLRYEGNPLRRSKRSVHSKSFSRFTASSGSSVPRTRCISGCTRSLASLSLALSVGYVTINHVAAESPTPSRIWEEMRSSGAQKSTSGVVKEMTAKANSVRHPAGAPPIRSLSLVSRESDRSDRDGTAAATWVSAVASDDAPCPLVPPEDAAARTSPHDIPGGAKGVSLLGDWAEAEARAGVMAGAVSALGSGISGRGRVVGILPGGLASREDVPPPMCESRLPVPNLCPPFRDEIPRPPCQPPPASPHALLQSCGRLSVRNRLL
mmetsp:Transcript_3293/g.6595  ORF Transcript_3293/g.6595 Transcript_3293/m.6595 type:complete len:267 (-) Transcript_3293:20-820(-)